MILLEKNIYILQSRQWEKLCVSVFTRYLKVLSIFYSEKPEYKHPKKEKEQKTKTKTRKLEWGLKPRECQSNFSQHNTQQMITSGAAGAKASALWTSSWAILAQPLKPFALPIMPQKFQAASDTTLKDSTPQELNCASSSLQPEPWK